MFNFGVRFCSVGFGGKAKGKHAVKRQDVVFHDTSGRKFSTPQYASFLKELGTWGDKFKVLGRVGSMVTFTRSSKVRKVVGRVEVLGRRSAQESEFLDDLAFWTLCECGIGVLDTGDASVALSYQGERSLFARAHVGRTKAKVLYTANLTAKDVSLATKETAKILKLNPDHFSSHSWKVGSTTDLALQGEGADVVRRLGDHAANSASTFTY